MRWRCALPPPPSPPGGRGRWGLRGIRPPRAAGEPGRGRQPAASRPDEGRRHAGPPGSGGRDHRRPGRGESPLARGEPLHLRGAGPPAHPGAAGCFGQTRKRACRCNAGPNRKKHQGRRGPPGALDMWSVPAAVVYFRRLRPQTTAPNPARPDPSSKRVEGSGVGHGGVPGTPQKPPSPIFTSPARVVAC